MSLLLDGLRALGVSGNLFVAGVLLVGALYLFRGKRYAGSAAAAAGTATGYTLALLVALGATIALGWIEPNPDLITDGVSAAVDPLADVATSAIEMVIDTLIAGLVGL